MIADRGIEMSIRLYKEYVVTVPCDGCFGTGTHTLFDEETGALDPTVCPRCAGRKTLDICLPEGAVLKSIVEHDGAVDVRPSDSIRDLEMLLAGVRRDLDDVVVAIQVRRRSVARQIEEEWQTLKTPEYSNAQKRAEALDLAMAQSEAVQALEETRTDLDLRIARLQIDLGFERREFQREMQRGEN